MVRKEDAIFEIVFSRSNNDVRHSLGGTWWPNIMGAVMQWECARIAAALVRGWFRITIARVCTAAALKRCGWPC